MAEGDFEAAVEQVIRDLQPGEVTSYGEIAAEAGFPGAARAVGNFLRGSTGLPWWRVVSASGRLIPGNEQEQAQRLKAEGIALTVSGRVPGSILKAQ